MKKIHILESKLNESWLDSHPCAGTDHPYFEDEKTGEIYEANWDSDYGFPFGYWPIDYNGTMDFSIGDAWTTHVNACGKCAEQYFDDLMYEQVNDAAYDLGEAIKQFASDFKGYGYHYDEENDVWVSEDGSDERDINDFVDEIMDNVSCPVDVYDFVYDIVDDYLDGNTELPSNNEIYEHISNELSSYDFTTQEGIEEAMQSIGMDFYQYFEMGELEGRIWPRMEMIGFYTTERPEPMALNEILENLSKRLNISLDELYDYHMVFENWRDSDGEITACTISDYIKGNYGDYSDDEEEVGENEPQYARQEKTVFVPHLANQEDKREFFKGFRDTRDKAVYAPRERGAGNLARYHALRYPYGENKEINRDMKKIIRLTESDLHNIVKGAVQRILEGDAWEKYPDEDRTQAELDANRNHMTSGEFANAYTRDDPMVRNVEGSTLRHMLKANMGNNIR